MKDKDKDPYILSKEHKDFKEVVSMILETIALVLLSIVAFTVYATAGFIISIVILIQLVAHFIRRSNED